MSTIEEMRGVENARLVIEGDWGGTIYLSCPVPLIGATHPEILDLAEWLERQCWSCNFDEDGDAGHWVFFEIVTVGTHILGGMGGGIHVNGLWIHEDVEFLRDEIVAWLKLGVDSEHEKT